MMLCGTLHCLQVSSPSSGLGSSLIIVKGGTRWTPPPTIRPRTLPFSPSWILNCGGNDPYPAAAAAAEGPPTVDAPPVAEVEPPQDLMASKIDDQQWWAVWQNNGTEMRSRIAKLGLAAILGYGLFDGVTYSTFFILAFLGYEKSTGKNPAADIQALIGIVILMWTGNNVTRPLRIAGAAALAPLIDRMLRKVQRALNLPNQFLAFVMVAASFASLCLSIVGLLIISRWKS